MHGLRQRRLQLDEVLSAIGLQWWEMYEKTGVIVVGVFAGGLLHVQLGDVHWRVGSVFPAQLHLDRAIVFWLSGRDVHRDVCARDRMEGNQPQATNVFHRLNQLRTGTRTLYMGVAFHVRLQTEGVGAL